MKMNRVRKNQRLLAALLLVVMLIPMLAMMAYASAKYPYTVSFGYSGDTKYVYGTKTDTAYYAAASIKSGTFNGGSVTFQLERSNGSELSYPTGPFYGLGNYDLFYYADAVLIPPVSVRVAATSNGSVSYISGNFQP